MNSTLSIVRDLNNEIWKDIDEFVGVYQVSNMGRVKSMRRSWIDAFGTKHQIEDRLCKGYKQGKTISMCLAYRNRRTKLTLDRLVAKYFLKKVNGKNYLIHLDNNFENNKVSNLRWVTLKEKREHEKPYNEDTTIKHESEIWRDVKGFENIYQVSNKGRFRLISKTIEKLSGKTITRNVIKEQKIKNGKSYVQLRLNGVEHTFDIERLVAETFVPNEKKKSKVAHNDQDTLNNKSANLRWSKNENSNNHNQVSTKRFSINVNVNLNKNVKVSANTLDEAKEKVIDLIQRNLITFDFQNDVTNIKCKKF